MHFSANVEESPLQTDAETGGEPELGTSGKDTWGFPALLCHCREVGWQYLPCE